MGFDFKPFTDSILGGARNITDRVGKAAQEVASRVVSDQSLEEMTEGVGKDFAYTKPGEASRDKEILMYPQGLGETPEFMNFISFEIYESGGTSMDSNKESFLSSVVGGSGLATITAGLQVPAVGQNATGFLSGIAKSVGGDKLASIAGKLDAGTFGAAGAMITSGMATDIGMNLYNSKGIGKLENDAGVGWTQEKTGLGLANKKVNKTIYLYLPGGMGINYAQTYQDSDDMSGAQAVADLIKTTGNTVKSVLEGTSDAGLDQLGSELAKNMAQGLSSKVSDMVSKATEAMGLQKVNLKQYYQALNRQLPNPMILSLFQSTSRRTFSLEYEFIPTSQRELEEVYNIIETFKKYSHPKRSSDAGRMLDYPAEFKLTFYYGTNENKYIPRLSRCALTKVGLTYGDKPFNTFRPNEKGAAPTKIKMTLDFNELNILTQEEIERGY